MGTHSELKPLLPPGLEFKDIQGQQLDIDMAEVLPLSQQKKEWIALKSSDRRAVLTILADVAKLYGRLAELYGFAAEGNATLTHFIQGTGYTTDGRLVFTNPLVLLSPGERTRSRAEVAEQLVAHLDEFLIQQKIGENVRTELKTYFEGQLARRGLTAAPPGALLGTVPNSHANSLPLNTVIIRAHLQRITSFISLGQTRVETVTGVSLNGDVHFLQVGPVKIVSRDILPADTVIDASDKLLFVVEGPIDFDQFLIPFIASMLERQEEFKGRVIEDDGSGNAILMRLALRRGARGRHRNRGKAKPTGAACLE